MKPADQVFVGLPGPELDRASAEILAAHQPGGVILFKRNLQDEHQLNRLMTALRHILPDAVVGIDAEGGRVDRLKEIVGPAPAAAALAEKPPSCSVPAWGWGGDD